MLAERKIKIEDYDYALPDERIAFFPPEQRDQSKLLVYKDKKIIDSQFNHLPDFLNQNTLLIFNNSKVIHARLLVHNANGAAIEIFCLEPLYPTTELALAFVQTQKVIWKCMVGNAKKWKDPILIQVDFEDQKLEITAEKGAHIEGAFEVKFLWPDPSITFAEWIEVYGKMPLPPYIKRAAQREDENRYQTVYAKYDGSVAAPTAGLHFSENVFAALAQKGIETDYVTLHVGAGTFKPVSADTVGEHFMHQEQMLVTISLIDHLLASRSKVIIAVGTTVARTLESLYVMGAKILLKKENPFLVEQWELYENSDIMQFSMEQSLQAIKNYLQQHHADTLVAATRLMILPTYEHKITKGIITNFHQPKSTLLLLIASYLGEEWKTIYLHALQDVYRFLSFGDSNLYLNCSY
ncbi:MAG: S-adenosylmethionine:tRNA ribosyltransferase-isomerase [Bacteroidales bacterium]